MALLSALITSIRTEISDDNSTRFTDAQILSVLRRALSRANRIAQRNGLQFAKKSAAITTTANQAYVTLSTSVTDFDVPIGLYRDGTHERIPFRTEDQWERMITAGTLDTALLDYNGDKIQFAGTPDSAETLTLWYYPTISTASYTAGMSSPWSGRLDDIIIEYTANRLKNIDEMDVTFDVQLMTDMETQILQAYAPNSPTIAEGEGWTGNI